MNQAGTFEVMLDLETMGTGNNAAIVSIGAVKMDMVNFELIGDGEFYSNVELASCVKAGLRMDPDTVMWWLRQSDAARNALTEARNPLFDVLRDFSAWCRDSPVWGNASTFDNVILRNAYTAVNLRCPWRYTNDRCYRTMKQMFPGVPRPPENTSKHNALEDAKWQAQHLLNIGRVIAVSTNG